ncbi:MAG: hypothetical protein V4677_12255 [Bacteroidota bacterium]
MPFEIIETDKYVIKISVDFSYMEYLIKEGVTIDVEDVVMAKAVVLEVTKKKLYVFSEGAEFFTLTKKARELCASTGHLDNTIAIAFYTTNTSIYLLGDIFNKINKPPVPTRIFRDRYEAKEWLREQARKSGSYPEF